MAKYHINDKGDPGVCRAKNKCRFGDMEKDHYTSESAARSDAEARLSELYGSEVTLTKATRKEVKAADEKALEDQNKAIKKYKLKKGSTLDLYGATPAGADYTGKITRISPAGRIFVKPSSIYDTLPVSEVRYNPQTENFDLVS